MGDALQASSGEGEKPSGTPFLYTRKDFQNALVLYARMTPKRWLLLVVVVALVLAFFSYSVPDWDDRLAAIVSAAIGGALAYAIGRFIYLPWLAGRQYSRQPLAKIENVVSLRPDGLNFSSDRGEMRFLWSDFIGWRADDRMVIVFRGHRLLMMVPTRLAAEGFPIEALKRALAAHIGPR